MKFSEWYPVLFRNVADAAQAIQSITVHWKLGPLAALGTTVALVVISLLALWRLAFFLFGVKRDRTPLSNDQLSAAALGARANDHDNASHLIITVHGIRTFGDWQERLEKLVLSEGAGIEEVINYKFGYFSTAAFIIPIFRWFVVRRFRRELIRLCAAKSRSRVDLVGHSFGTHIIGWSVAKLPVKSNVVIHTVILSGSVLKPGFAWRDLIGTRVKRVVNDCGTKDAVLLLSQFFVLFTGMAGRTGFSGSTSELFRNRYSRFGHGGYFHDSSGKSTDDYMRMRWVPLLLDDGPISQFDDRKSGVLDGIVVVFANNAEPIKLMVYVAPLVFILWWIFGLYVTAAAERDFNQRFLDVTLKETSTIVTTAVELANAQGISREAIIQILDKTKGLYDELRHFGRKTAELDRRQALMRLERARSYRSVGHTELALADAQIARDVLLRLQGSGGTSVERDLARARVELGDGLLDANRRVQAIEEFNAANKIWKALAASDPADDEAKRGVALTSLRTGRALIKVTQRHAEAEAAILVAQEISERLASASTDNWSDRLEATRAVSNLADLLLEKSRVPEALEKFEQVLKTRRELATPHAGNADLQLALSETLQLICYYRATLEQLEAALAACTEALGINESLAAQDRTSAVRKGRLARVRLYLADVYERRQSLDQALALYKDALAVMERLAALDPLNAERQFDVASALTGMAGVMAKLGDRSGAAAAYRLARDAIERMRAVAPDDEAWQTALNFIKGEAKRTLGDDALLSEPAPNVPNPTLGTRP